MKNPQGTAALTATEIDEIRTHRALRACDRLMDAIRDLADESLIAGETAAVQLDTLGTLASAGAWGSEVAAMSDVFRTVALAIRRREFARKKAS
jgi:hypothetical protein